MADSPTYRTKAFISYSRKDKKYLERLQAHLKPFVRESNIQVWDDTQIPPGGDWQKAIEQALAEAQVAILLVSVGFLASDFVAAVELPKILAAAEKEGATILLVILEHCAFKLSKLGKLQSVNDPASPLASSPQHKQDKIWSQVAEMTHDTLKAKEQEWSEKAKSLFDARDNEETLVAAEHAIHFNAENASAYKYKGAALFWLDRDGEALEALEHSLRLNPNDGFALTHKGAALYWLGREEEALSVLDLALEFDGRYPYTFEMKGRALFNLQRYEEALISLEQALNLLPQDTDLLNYKGAALFHLQRYEEALEALKIVSEPTPFTFGYKGAVLFHLQRYEEALEALEKADEDEALVFIYVFIYKGATLFYLGREVEALSELNWVDFLEPVPSDGLGPNDVFALKYFGAALVNLEQEGEALPALEKALKFEPNDLFALRYKGAALHGLKKYEEALSVLEQVLKLEPGDEEALKLKNRIEKILEYQKKLAQVEAVSAPRKVPSS